MWKFLQQLNFGSETWQIWPKVGTWTCPSCPKVSKWGRHHPKHPSFWKKQQNQFLKSKSLLKRQQDQFFEKTTESVFLWGGTRAPPPHPALYIPYIFHIYFFFLNIFHICSLVCFLIYEVNRSFWTSKIDSVVFSKQRRVSLEGFALTWRLWDMMDMSMFRLLVQFRTFRVQNRIVEVISKWFCMVLCGGVHKTLFFH